MIVIRVMYGKRTVHPVQVKAVVETFVRNNSAMKVALIVKNDLHKRTEIQPPAKRRSYGTKENLP